MEKEKKHITERQQHTCRYPIRNLAAGQVAPAAPRNNLYSGNGKQHDDEEICAGIAKKGHRVERFLLKYIEVTLDKFKDQAGSSVTDQVVDFLLQDIISNFQLSRKWSQQAMIARLSLEK